MISNLKVQTLQKQPILNQQSIEVKKFVQNAFHIDYINTSQLYSENLPKTTDVKINNYLCYQKGQTLFKITEIIYDDKLIRIQDKFQLTVDQMSLVGYSRSFQENFQTQNKKSSRSNQKIRIFTKKAIITPNQEKKDKKNIVKNIIKIFLSYLEKKSGSNDISNSGLIELLKVMQNQNFNNRLIKKIVVNSLINKEFIKFIQEFAEEQIKYSRIQDKQSHYQALQVYKKLLQNGSRLSSRSNSESKILLNKQSLQQTPSNQITCKSQQSLNKSSQSSSNQRSLQPGVKINEISNENIKRNKIILIQNGRESKCQ